MKRWLIARVSSERDKDKVSQRKEGKVSVRRKGGTRVGSFTHANVQHPQAEEAVKLKNSRKDSIGRGTAHRAKGAQKGT